MTAIQVILCIIGWEIGKFIAKKTLRPIVDGIVEGYIEAKHFRGIKR